LEPNNIDAEDNMTLLSLVRFVFLALLLCATQAIAATTPPKGAVLTWHDDNFRTGWQQQETILNTSTISSLRISHQLVLPDYVDAQPLVIPGFINSHDIVFVADESNWVSQIDANTGTVLKQVNLGRPIPTPLKCANNGPNVGINATPVIDWASQTLFVVAYVNANPAVNPPSPTYFIHALDLVTLKDKVPPLKLAASHTLTDGSATTFDATYQRQRAGLLFANNRIYAGFTSFCDFTPNKSRGWLLGWSWNGTALTALPANQLDDRQTAPSTFFLSTIWMSGAGPASDESGNLIFATGNSDGPFAKTSTWTDSAPCSETATGTVPTNVPCSNTQESVVKIKGDLTGITGLFSPNAHYGSFSPDTLQLDQKDQDLGSGGVLLVPQRGSALLAAIGAKDGRLFLFDRAGAGLKFLQLRQGLGCYCAPSYFTGSDGVGRIVASHGNVVQTFQIPATTLSPEGTSSRLSTGQDPGFFTTVSCNGGGAFGNCINTPIIWAVSRPISNSSNGVNLYGFSGSAVGGSYPLLFGPTKVGSWLSVGAHNANIVPTISNGRVYVAAWRLLTILNLKVTPAAAVPLADTQEGASGALARAETQEGAAAVLARAETEAAAPPTNGFAISGTLHSVNGSMLTFTNRDGKERLIDASEAMANGLIAPALIIGEAYTAVGSSFTAVGALHADAINRSKCRQHNEAGADLTAQQACTGDQWPPDKDPGQQ
jgi:hypothetical protein